MIGKNKGFTTLLHNHIMTLGHTGNLTKLHYVIHQEALCAKTASLKNVMNITIKVVNTSLSNKLNHLQFKKVT